MATVTELLDALDAYYDNYITANRLISDVDNAIGRAGVRRGAEGKAFIALARGIVSGGGGGGSGITQSEVTSAIQNATNIDGLETLIGTTNTSLAAISGFVDGLEGFTDGLETLIGTTNTTLTALNGFVDGLEALETTISGKITSIDDKTLAGVISSYPAQSAIVVTDAGVTLLSARATRIHAIVKNRSDTDACELTFAGTALTFGNGLILDPGQSYQIDRDNLWRGAVTARTNAGISVSVSVLDGVI